MKRLYLCFLLLVAVLFPVDVMAAEANLTHGKPFTISKGIFIPGSLTYVLTDGDFNGDYVFLEDASQPNANKTAWMTFDKTYDVTKVYQGGNRPSGVRFDFYGENQELIKSFVPSTNNNYDIYVKGVKSVAAVNNYSGLGNAVRELIVWGITDDAPPGEVSGIVTSNITSSSIKLSWIEPSDEDFAETILFRDGSEVARIQKGTSTYTDTGLQPNTPYTYKFVTADNNGNRSPGVNHQAKTTEIDMTPPGEITNIKTTVYNDRIKVTWTNPSDLDFLEVRIFKEGVLVAVAVTPATQFTDYDLQEHTTYTYLFRTVDNSGNFSPGVSVTEKTKGKPPKVTNLVGIPGYAQAELMWKPSNDRDVTSYNIYQNGIKVRSNVKDPFALMSGLENGKTYQYQVAAVSQWGESELSDPVELTPEEWLVGSIYNLRASEKKTSYIKFAWDQHPVAERYKVEATIKRNKLASVGLSDYAAPAPEETITQETEATEFTINNLSPGDEVNLTVSGYSATHGYFGSTSLAVNVPVIDTPGETERPPSATDVVGSSFSLAFNFWWLFLIGAAMLISPWLFKTARSALGKKRAAQMESARRTGRATNRQIRLDLRRK